MTRATAGLTSRPPYRVGQVGTTRPERPNTGYQASYSARERAARTAAAPPRSPASRQASGTCSATQARTLSAAASALVSGPIATRPTRSLRVLVTGSSSREARLPPLPEGGEALAKVLAARRQLQGEGLVAKVRLQRRPRGSVHEPLGEPQGDGGAGRQPGDQRLGLLVEVASRDDPVDEAPRLRLGAVDTPTEQQHLPRPQLADPAGQQPRGPAVGGEAALGERLPHQQVVSRHREVSGQDEMQPDPRHPSS